MTLDDLIQGASLLREIHGGDVKVGAKTPFEITLSVSLSGPPVIVATENEVQNVILLIIEKNKD